MRGSDLQKTIIELFLYDGWLVLRPNSGTATYQDESGKRFVVFIRWYAMGYIDDAGGNTTGVADVLAFHPSNRLAIEVKGDGDMLSQDQELFLEAWERSGGVSIVARSVDDVAPYLTRMEVQ